MCVYLYYLYLHIHEGKFCAREGNLIWQLSTNAAKITLICLIYNIQTGYSWFQWLGNSLKNTSCLLICFTGLSWHATVIVFRTFCDLTQCDIFCPKSNMTSYRMSEIYIKHIICFELSIWISSSKNDFSLHRKQKFQLPAVLLWTLEYVNQKISEKKSN